MWILSRDEEEEMNGKPITIEPYKQIKVKNFKLLKTFTKDKFRIYSLALCNFSKDDVLIQKSKTNKEQYQILVSDEMYLKRNDIFNAISKREYK